MALTDSKLKSINGKTHNGLPIKISDRDGLYIYHRKTGSLSFVFRYRFKGVPKELALGQYPVMSLAEARVQALECKRIYSEHKDPKLERRINKEKALDAKTVKESLEYWLDNYAQEKRANHDKHRAQFSKHIYPYYGHLPVERLDAGFWSDVFTGIAKGVHHKAAPTASGYIFQNIKQALKFCRVRNFAQSHALEDLTVLNLTAVKKQNKGMRVLSWPELMDVWNWSQRIDSNWYYKNLTKLLITFGCRSQELRLSKVHEWDLENMIWTVPPEHNKTAKKEMERGGTGKIIRPIPELAKPLIEALIAQSADGYILGELKNPEAVSSFGGSLWKKLRHEERWTFHDLRRTFSTMLNDLGIEPHLVETLLGHAVIGVAGIYNRAGYTEQKRAALNLWLSKLDGLEAGSNVVGLR